MNSFTEYLGKFEQVLDSLILERVMKYRAFKSKLIGFRSFLKSINIVS